jgi:hypothetical protein
MDGLLLRVVLTANAEATGVFRCTTVMFWRRWRCHCPFLAKTRTFLRAALASWHLDTCLLSLGVGVDGIRLELQPWLLTRSFHLSRLLRAGT